jgi:hypothetical protein
MDTLVMASVVAPFVLLFAWVATSLRLARRKNAELFASAPAAMPYTWGFFLGYSGLIGTVVLVAAATAMGVTGRFAGWAPVVFVYALASGAASYGVLTRRRWGWLAHIPLSLNPGLWAFNSVYVHNRWREFGVREQLQVQSRPR